MPKFYRRGSTKRYARKRYKMLGARGTLVRSRRVMRGYRSAMLNSFVTHHFKRRASVEITNSRELELTNNPTGFVSEAHLFRLSDVVNPTEITNLYDQYRINKIIIEIKWSILAGNSGLSNIDMLNPPVLYYRRDYDDITTDLTEDGFMENSRTKSFVLNPNKIYKLVLVPAQLHRVFNTTVSDGYAVKWRQWTDTANANVNHYGIKLGCKYPANDAYGSLMVNAIYYFSCKNAR